MLIEPQTRQLILHYTDDPLPCYPLTLSPPALLPLLEEKPALGDAVLFQRYEVKCTLEHKQKVILKDA